MPEDLSGNLTFVVGTPKEARALEPEEERRLIRTLNDDMKVTRLARSQEKWVQALRNRALVGAGLLLGLRAEEAVSLNWEQVVLWAGAAEARDVVGKYGLVRSIPIANAVRKVVLGPEGSRGRPVSMSRSGRCLPARRVAA